MPLKVMGGPGGGAAPQLEHRFARAVSEPELQPPTSTLVGKDTIRTTKKCLITILIVQRYPLKKPYVWRKPYVGDTHLTCCGDRSII